MWNPNKESFKFQGDAGGAEDKQQDCDQFNARKFQVSLIFPGHISLGNLKFLI